MIVNMLQVSDKKDTQEVVNILTNSHFSFYLTGSRFANMHKPDSDWDFFVQDTSSVRNFLQNLGFISIPHNYLDQLTNEVFLYQSVGGGCFDEDSIHNNGGIHVQLVTNAAVKHDIQTEMVKYKTLLYRLSKPERCQIWNLCIDTQKNTGRLICKKMLVD